MGHRALSAHDTGQNLLSQAEELALLVPGREAADDLTARTGDERFERGVRLMLAGLTAS
ncbi:hypothetical protein [Nonomuraea sp. NPDC049158]|uniref:hypothetical protein n=1 Tax=Nonomuraea sp. NPDC049158 TaxID=3155649 RepID=UPI0033F284ED